MQYSKININKTNIVSLTFTAVVKKEAYFDMQYKF